MSLFDLGINITTNRNNFSLSHSVHFLHDFQITSHFLSMSFPRSARPISPVHLHVKLLIFGIISLNLFCTLSDASSPFPGEMDTILQLWIYIYYKDLPRLLLSPATFKERYTYIQICILQLVLQIMPNLSFLIRPTYVTLHAIKFQPPLMCTLHRPLVFLKSIQ